MKNYSATAVPLWWAIDTTVSPLRHLGRLVRPEMLRLFTLEHGAVAYRADFALYTCATASLFAGLLFWSPHAHWLQSCALVTTGLLSWTLVEYVMHRFILHGLEPFCSWHAAHHARPTALIFTPTLLSASLIGVLVFMPAVLCGSIWQACALTLGVLAGYLAYTVTHHATHHWRARSTWLRRRKGWHARHHHLTGGCYGVTSGIWDYVFSTNVFPTIRQAEQGRL
ncbi:sterol desaturase family protein [Acidovorax sp. A1169]|uniref:sterol desaturase family protein n=1 Tax=Acidovorax sp. A1169 TaxID=3059524 RepID=UPI0027377D97|nr:sterol desaturase family protein [Acidovorax sp. A1169]MDP4078683.1 sterol desaturase family protein [Acidovorax sp. A1169]